MNAYFFDTSALVKRYSPEDGSTWVLGIVRPSTGNLISISSISRVEVVSALTRKLRAGFLTQARYQKAIKRFERETASRFFIAEPAPEIIIYAVDLAKAHGLRGYDAIQLATAFSLGKQRAALGLSQLILVSSDKELNRAAGDEGFTVEDPNSHL